MDKESGECANNLFLCVGGIHKLVTLIKSKINHSFHKQISAAIFIVSLINPFLWLSGRIDNPDRELKVATFNIQHCKNFNTKEIDYIEFAEYMKSLDADIIGLNEVRGEGTANGYEAQAAILAEKIGYSCFFAEATDFGTGSPYGNAVLTRLNVKTCETIPIPDPEPHAYDGYYETRCILKLTLEDPDVIVLISHFGLNPDERENAVDTVIKNIPDGTCILMGDFNVTPNNPVLDPIREKLNDTAAYTEEDLFSFPSCDPKKKIDYIFVSPDIEVKSVYAPTEILSDHLPLVAELYLRA